MVKGMGSSYQMLRHWRCHVSSKQAKINTCQSMRDNDGVLSGKGRQWWSPVLVEQEGFQKQRALK